jgi:hydroxypyruvate isomerase
MVRFSANLGFLWPDRPLLDRVEAAAKAGFKAIELHWPYDVPATEVRAKCEAHGLTLLGINTVAGNVVAGEFGLGALVGRERDFQDAIDQSIRFCVEAGGSAIHCMAGNVDPEDRGKARLVFARNLREASGKATREGLTLLLEPINRHDAPDYFYSTAEEGSSIIEEAGCRNIKLMFDCYHVGLSGGGVLEKLARFFSIIGHVQIAAVPSRAEPDEGELDYPAVFTALETLGYDGWVGCEYKPRGTTDAGLVWTKALGVRL